MELPEIQPTSPQTLEELVVAEAMLMLCIWATHIRSPQVLLTFTILARATEAMVAQGPLWVHGAQVPVVEPVATEELLMVYMRHQLPAI